MHALTCLSAQWDMICKVYALFIYFSEDRPVTIIWLSCLPLRISFAVVSYTPSLGSGELAKFYSYKKTYLEFGYISKTERNNFGLLPNY